MKIIALKYGESVFEEMHIFKGGSPEVLLPISFVFYLIETGDKKILVDVGCDDGAGFEMSIFQKPVHILENYGLAATDITDVVITHAHHDHIAAIQPYCNATIHIQETEYQYGKDYIPATSNVHRFEDEFLLTSNIIIKKIGGHTDGSSIVLCHTKDRDYVLCGDECYIKACLDKQIPTGSSWHPDISENFVKKYSETNYVPLLFHDPGILKGKIGYEIIQHSASQPEQ